MDALASSRRGAQRAMSVPVRDRPPPPNLINQLLGNNFKAMESIGEAVMKPFLQARTRMHARTCTHSLSH